MTPPEIYAHLQVMKETASHWWYICPFHDDHKASMTVEKGGQYAGHFKCWACGERGSANKFAELTGIKAKAFFSTKKNHSPKAKKQYLDAATLQKYTEGYQAKAKASDMQKLADKLSVKIETLNMLRVGVAGKSYSFPMYDEKSRVIGIRYRNFNGAKTAMRGSRNGLFVPAMAFDKGKSIYITEGESDCLAALEIGFQAIGRPGNLQCKELIAKWLQEHGFHKALIVSDNDTAGQKGAKELADYLMFKANRETKIITPPSQYKDLRDWYKGGLLLADF